MGLFSPTNNKRMLSLAEIKEWADTVEGQSTSKLIKFSHNTDKPAHRAVTEIVFGHDVNEYRVWIFPEFNIIYVDAFHKGCSVIPSFFEGPSLDVHSNPFLCF